MSDLLLIISWWFLIFCLGASFLPLVFSLFQQFFDKGYALSKIFALLFISYSVWLLGSLEILSFSTRTIWLVITFFIVGNIILAKKNQTKFKKEVKKYWKIFALEEALFLTGLTFWSLIRGFQPNIQGLEKFMDFGFINSILRSNYFPPADMWLAGKTTNYYYFGHLVAAVLTKLSQIDSAITYNLMIATIFSLSLTASFSLGGNLVFISPLVSKGKQTFKKLKPVFIGGSISALLLNLGGNLHPLYQALTQGSLSDYWYPDATRFIVQQFGAADNTIHEFPLYSFVVADLHGHLSNLPFTLLLIALTLSLFTKKKIVVSYYLLAGLLLGTSFMTNAWDFPIYLLVIGGVFLWFNYSKWQFSWKSFWQTLKSCLLTLGLAFFFSLFFHLNFQSIIQGIALTDFHTPLWMLLVLWGFPLLTTIIFIRLFLEKRNTVDIFILILLVVSWWLILIPEIIYVKDIYIHTHQRANTMFKLTYQSFVMFSLVSGYIIVKALTKIKGPLAKVFFLLPFLGFFFFIFIYPYFAISSYYGLKTYRGLYGLQYFKTVYPDDYQATIWLKNNISDQPVLVEAVGESYTDFARISTNTGLPTILGWRVHEWLWRGSFDEPAKRTEEVKTIYESSDLSQIKQLLAKYRVRLIFIGDLERQQYAELQEEKFNQLGEIIFSSGSTKIYQVNYGLDI